MQRTFKCRNNFNSSMSNVMAIMRWILLVSVVMVLQQMKTIDAAKFNGESCTTKEQPGICREWSECPLIKTLIESGQYTKREVVNCGFGVREELICCPISNINTNTDNIPDANTNKDVFGIAMATTTAEPVRDFWLDLLKTTTSTTTTQKPDFWLDLLTTTTTAKPLTTTTIKPLIVGNQRLNETSEFFDLNALLSNKQSGGRKEERPVATTVESAQLNNVGFVGSSNGNANANGRRNLNGAVNNLSQWIFEEPGNNNNFRGNGNNGRGQGNRWGQSNGRVQGNGWGQNNGRGEANGWGRGHQNNGRGRPGNQNRGFTFPNGNARPNQFFEEDILPPNHKSDRPVNSFVEQNPNFENLNPNSNPTFNLDSNHNHAINDNKNKHEHIENLIKDVFNTSFESNKNLELPSSTQKNPIDADLEKSIANVFNLSPQKINYQAQQVNFQNNQQHALPAMSNPTTVWLTPQDITTLPGEYAQLPPVSQPPQQQVAFQNPHNAGHLQIVPIVEQQINGNDLETAPSTNFIQQPVVVETWSNMPVAPQPQAFNPVQVVYENILNSGMDIVKSNELQPQPQVVVFQTTPTQSHQHFVQQPQQAQVFFQQPLAQHPPFIQQQSSQQLIDQPQQSESLMKETRSTSTPPQKSKQQSNSNNGLMPNIQSPHAHALDPFKPFEFRPLPANEITFSEDNNSLSPNTTPNQRTNNGERAAARACRRIEQGLTASLSPHVLGGTPAELGEFPHMVGLGYSRIGGDNRQPYDVRCGGTLIDKRFVLTAAHCVSERDNVPSIVRLGVVNFTDTEQMRHAVQLRIKNTFIHDNYTSRLSYNDIAILELERDVETSEYIYPTCLYMNESDPDPNIKLWVTGWGTINTTTRSFSNVLLKAPLHTTPLENCNSRIVEYGLTRKIPEGIIRSQFCAEDKDQIKDACQGDSGGPLNLIVDESLKNYRLVGVVSTGFGCASSTPGLYTRVAAYLDFIERIVWPNGGD